MVAYPGLYRAKAVRLEGDKLIAFVPQVFGETSVTIQDFVGATPTTLDMGWVAFHGGHADYPIWMGAGVSSGGGGTVTDTLWVGPDAPTDASIEMWWDTDDTVDLDPRYVYKGGDVMTGPIQATRFIGTDAAPSAVNHMTRKDYVDGLLVPAWIDLAFGTNWTNYGTPSWNGGQYRKIGDTVYLRGLVKCTDGASSTIATLPSGYRPISNTMWVCWMSANGGVVRVATRVELGPTGTLVWANATSVPTGTTNAAITSVTHLNLDNCVYSIS